jgi:hypothetical protein
MRAPTSGNAGQGPHVCRYGLEPSPETSDDALGRSGFDVRGRWCVDHCCGLRGPMTAALAASLSPGWRRAGATGLSWAGAGRHVNGHLGMFRCRYHTGCSRDGRAPRSVSSHSVDQVTKCGRPATFGGSAPVLLLNSLSIAIQVKLISLLKLTTNSSDGPTTRDRRPCPFAPEHRISVRTTARWCARL